jgi:phosphoribosylaminoimidazole-succinocarboxamide synthase
MQRGEAWNVFCLPTAPRHASRFSGGLKAVAWRPIPVFQKPSMSASVPPQNIDFTQLGEPVYRGSVQHLYAIPSHPDFMVAQTTEAGSVFDVGSIFTIKDNDVNRAVFRHALYTRLGDCAQWRRVKARIEAQPGMDEAWRREMLSGSLERMVEDGAATHHVGMADAVTGEIAVGRMPEHASCYNVVRRFPVMKPPQRPFLGGHVFDYEQFYQSSTYVIPLEYIVRFGVTGGSSILRKYEGLLEGERRRYEQELGLPGVMRAWQMLPQPIFDLTSKYEPEDRNVSRQEALLMSGLGAPNFLTSIKMALLGAWVVRDILDELGLTLWDMKWEFAVDGLDTFYVDTVDTDSFRATSLTERAGHRLVLHYNKQAMRDYYKIIHADWFAGINEAKKEAAKQGGPFTAILQAGQQSGRWRPTPVVDEDFLALQVEKTQIIRDHMLGRTSDARVLLQRCGEAEVNFYESRGKLGDYAKLNAV